jgi:hypothetical protein
VITRVVFKEITPDFYRARLAEVKEKTGPYGMYLRLVFSITDGPLTCLRAKHRQGGYRFQGSVKPHDLKQGKFYHWVTSILQSDPSSFLIDDLIDKECLVFLSKSPKGFYRFTDVRLLNDWPFLLNDWPS